MKLGIHFANFTLPGGPGSLSRPWPTRRGRRSRAAARPSRSWTTGSRWRQLATRRTRCSRATPRSASWPASTERMTLSLLVTGVTYRHPGPAGQDRHHPRRAFGRPGRTRASARPGTSASTSGSACPSHRSASGSSGSRRRCRSACRCGATTTAPTRAGTTSWPRRSARPGRSQQPRPADPHRRQRRAEDPSAGGPATPTPATSSPPARTGGPQARRPARATATREAPRPGRHREDHPWFANPLDDIDGFLASMEEYAKLGIERSSCCPGPGPGGMGHRGRGAGGPEAGGNRFAVSCGSPTGSRASTVSAPLRTRRREARGGRRAGHPRPPR